MAKPKLKQGVRQINGVEYEVSSFTKFGEKYKVNMQLETCTCEAFARGRRPCKHILMMQGEVKETPQQKEDNLFMGDESVEQKDFEMRTIQGYPLDEVVSTLQKEIRRGNEEAALYWALCMVHSNFSGYMWRRLCVIAGEDIGIANPHILSLVVNGKMACEIAMKGKKDAVETDILATIIITMCRSKKSREACWMDLYISQEMKRPDAMKNRPIPDYGIDQHTKRGKMMGRGKQFFVDEGAVLSNDIDATSKWTVKGMKEYPKQDFR